MVAYTMALLEITIIIKRHSMVKKALYQFKVRVTERFGVSVIRQKKRKIESLKWFCNGWKTSNKLSKKGK